MAISNRPFVMTTAALATAAAIATTAPAIVSGQIAGVPSPAKLSTAQFELTGISNISVAGISDALSSGWGGFIGANDAFYPGEFNNDVKVTGPTGVAYYLLDNALDGIDPYNLENYFFEVGAKTGNVVAGLGAVAYVGTGSILGADSPVTQLVKSIVGGGGTGGADLGSLIMNATSGIPVVSDLASVYFTGQIAGDATVYGTGFAGLLSYANTKLLPGLGGALSNLNLTSLISGLSGLISQVGGLIGGHSIGGHEHHADSDEAEGTETDADDESEGSKHWDKHHSAAAVAVRVAAPLTVATAPAAAVTAGKPAASESTSKDVDEVTVGTAAPDTETAEAPKRARTQAARAAHAAEKAAEKAAASGHNGNRGKGHRTAN